MDADRYRRYAPLLLRIGLSLVFLWFGVNQLINPEAFLGYVPQWAYNFPVSPPALIMGNAIFEIVFGTLLIFGMFTRVSSLLLGLHLIGIMVGLGYNDIAVRDFGLMLAAFSVVLYGPDEWSLDVKRKA